MNIYSRFNKRPTEATETGIKERPIYGIEYDETGHKEVIVKGLTDRYEKTQERKDSVNIELILARATSPEDLNRVIGTYGDFTELPTTYIERLNMVQNATEAFNALPINIKEQYNMSVDQFIADIGSEKFNKLMKIETKTPDREITDPIQKEEVI